MILNIFYPLFISLFINYLVMFYSWLKKTDHYLDLTYGLTFFILGLFSLLYNKNYTYQMFFTLTIIMFWAIRLSVYLYIRIKINKSDKRIQKFLKSFKKFFILWTSQAIIIWLILFPIYFLSYYKIKGNIYFIIFIFIAFLFLFLETVADYQKFMHKKTSNKIITTGVWKYSRHINYFGEISFWTTIAIFVMLNNFNLFSLISLIGPMTIILIIYKVSGLPMIEKLQYEKHKDDILYKKYIKNTPCLIPFIGKKGLYKNLK